MGDASCHCNQTVLEVFDVIAHVTLELLHFQVLLFIKLAKKLFYFCLHVFVCARAYDQVRNHQSCGMHRILQNIKSCGLSAPRWHESPSPSAAGAAGGSAANPPKHHA